MITIEEIDSRIAIIERRNRIVEMDKAWETSVFRKILLMIFTYISIGLYMYVIEVKNPWINAVIPTIGFFLSTLTLPYFKSFWKNYTK